MRSGLPLQIPLRKGFLLGDVIDEMALLLNVSVSSCLRMLQLQPDNRQRLKLNRPIYLNDSESAIFAHLFHAQIDQVSEMTLQYFVKRLPRQARGKKSVEHHEQLLERVLGLDYTTIRICPVCIAEGRPRRLVWQSRWLFACTRHKVLLVDRCPSCGEPPASRRRLSRVPRLFCCDKQSTRSDRCAQRLDLIPTVLLSDQTNILWAQHRLEACMQGVSFAILDKKLSAIEFLRACGDLAEILIPILNADSSKRSELRMFDQPALSSLHNTDFSIKPIDLQVESGSWKFRPVKNLWAPHNVALIAPVILSLVQKPNLQSLEDAIFNLISEACSIQKMTPQQVVRDLESKLNHPHRSRFYILFRELLHRLKRHYRLFDVPDPDSLNTFRPFEKTSDPRQKFTWP